jgi:glucosamine--fructose-6-phosphate aminotransferase (isomerizing)
MSDERPSSLFEQEVRQQPEALARLLARGRPGVDALGDRIRRFQPRLVVIAARGSSDNAARYATYLFGARHGLVTALASPSLVTRYHATLRLNDAVVFGVSQSGQSPDIVATVEHAANQGALTIALTNDVESPLAAAAQACLYLDAGEERAVAASKTYTNELLGFAMLSAAIGSDPRAWDELAAVPDAVRATVALAGASQAQVASFSEVPGFAVIGRGFNAATAHEVALKTMEITYLMTQAFALPDFMHGPVAMLDSRLPTIVIAPGGVHTADMLDFLGVVRRRGGHAIVISDRAEVLSAGDVPLPMAEGLPEWLSPLSAIVPGQFWALALAHARGVSPDRPRGLSKVTETE